MKINSTYVDYPWLRGYNQILDEIAHHKDPILIIRKSNPSFDLEIADFFKKKEYTFIRLSESCSTSSITSEIILQCKLKIPLKAKGKYSNLKKIGRSLEAKKRSMVIVIDNFHRVMRSQLFRIVQMVHLFNTCVRFILVIPQIYFTKWMTSEGEGHLFFFRKILNTTYAMGEI